MTLVNRQLELEAIAGRPISATQAAKMTPPALAATQVVRKRICDRVCAATDARLVVLQAPVGFGKTTAMLQCRAALAAQGVNTAWITLERSDNQPGQFVASMELAVRQLSAAGEREPFSARVLEWLLRSSVPFAIFLDNMDLIDEESILALLRSVIERLPRGGRIIIGARTAPRLGLARLRGLGMLLELDADDIRFTREETEQYFRLRCLPGLSQDSVRRLHEKTEGWIVALCLAAISIERQGDGGDFVERFSGSAWAIADYLTEEVLASQPEDVRRFLLHTSILKQLDASICQALLPDIDAQAMLGVLDKQGLFLLPAAGHGQTWRYHTLFADYLQSRLVLEKIETIAGLHLAAARWYESRQRPVPAIGHAIEGGDYALAMSLLRPNARRLLEDGRMRLLARWFRAIPPSMLRENPELEVMSIWATLFTRGPWDAADELARSGRQASGAASVTAHLNALNPTILAMQDRLDEARAAGLEGLARMPTGDRFADTILCNVMANVMMFHGEDQEAQRLLDEARRLQGSGIFNHMFAEALEGMLCLQRGRLQEAMIRFRSAPHATDDAPRRYANGNVWAGALYAAALYEVNDVEGADQLLGDYLPIISTLALPDHTIIGHTLAARIAFIQNDAPRAFDIVASLENIGHRRQNARFVAGAKLERSRLHLLQDDARAALGELERAAALPVWERIGRQHLPAQEVEYLALARLRWEIHFGDAAGALPALEREIDAAIDQCRILRAIRLRVLKSLALQRSGDLPAAMETLAGVLHHASREGFIRLLLDEGQKLAQLVGLFYASIEEMPARSSDAALASYVQRLMRAFGPAAVAPAVGAARPMEALTQKEIKVLQLVADGHSNSAISKKLIISDSTVRTHLRNVNSKFNARSRTEAVAIGRRLHIIR
ncbi:helix-turn-helix transcriptional regulator [Camelimonas fluminis]|uniref:LuxR C-terminal-related transcriptional regulator n=1 Tax=Camelimonas fluminis TaxID=1576911 RepID=A0ABV7UFQ0_9HYPH|nr:LuxR C-terminal-related transcriptional regulator [Camelimonas fluminis]GHE72420.1 helix-turn-helix transcriptional regulator [Camelimonas fluminis]